MKSHSEPRPSAGAEALFASDFQQTKAVFRSPTGHQDPPLTRKEPPQTDSNGLDDTRRHLCQVANLYGLCVMAVDKMVAPNVPAALRTSEWLQAAVASLFIESSKRITLDGVHWFSYVDKMPTKPLKTANIVDPD